MYWLFLRNITKIKNFKNLWIYILKKLSQWLYLTNEITLEKNLLFNTKKIQLIL